MPDPKPDRLPAFYALVWRASKPDAEFDPKEFESRIPRLMAWLRDLRAKGKLAACGGGGWATHAGGLTILRADTVEEALELSKGTPMNEIGATEVFVWDVYYADLAVPRTM